MAPLPVCPPPEDSVTITITQVSTSGRGSSFTSKTGEDTIRATVEVTPASLASSVQWEVRVATARSTGVGLPVATPASTGVLGEWIVPNQPFTRFSGYVRQDAITARSVFASSQTPFPNALRYGLTASVVDSAGVLHESAEVVVEQDEIDVIRQEYLDFATDSLPDANRFGRNTTANFGETDLAGFLGNGDEKSDFDIYIAESVLLNNLELIRTEVASRLGAAFPIILNSAYRHPVHHALHALAKSTESPHFVGRAADVRHTALPGNEKLNWLMLRDVAKVLGACYEREGLVLKADGTRSHAHFDWRLEPCPVRWSIP